MEHGWRHQVFHDADRIELRKRCVVKFNWRVNPERTIAKFHDDGASWYHHNAETHWRTVNSPNVVAKSL